jgi:glycosyltransferase involved in cell wall biosynthesis
MSLLASAWAEKGNRVTLLTFEHGDPPAYPLHASVRLKNLGLLHDSSTLWQGFRKNISRIRQLRRAISESQPEIVISFIDRVNILTLLATRRMGVPVVVSERIDPSLYEIGAVWSAMRRLTYPLANALICQTGSTLQRFENIAKVNGRIIPNPVPRPSGCARPPGVHQRLSSGHTVVAVGRLVPQKGYDLLLDAFARVAGRHADWSLKVLGRGPLRPQLEAQALALKLAERVQFLGEVADPFPILCSADLFVLPSRFEGFPGALCEAMACGLPVISFDCPSGPSDIVRHGLDGILVPPGDTGALAVSLDSLMGDPQERQRLGTRAPEVVTRFSLERILVLWQALFEDLLLPRSGG